MADELTCPICGEEKRIVGVQYAPDNPEAIDGISEIKCSQCGERTGRFSKKILAEGEYEKRSILKKGGVEK